MGRRSILERWSGNALTRSRRCVARKPIALRRRGVGRRRRLGILWRIGDGEIGARQIDAGQPARARCRRGGRRGRLRSRLGRLGRRVAQQRPRSHRRSAHARIGLAAGGLVDRGLIASALGFALAGLVARPNAGADDKPGDGRASDDGAADDGAGDTDEGGADSDDDVRGRTGPFPLPLGGVSLEFNAWRHHRLPAP